MDEIKKSEWYQEVSLEDAKLYIRSNLLSEARSFIASGYYLKHIRDHELYLEDGYKNISEFAYGEYGLSASATSRRMSINDRFSQNGNSPNIKDEFKDFRKSQLQEMLGLSEEQIEKVTPNTQVMQIREMKRGEHIAPYTGPQVAGQIDITDFPEYMPEETLLDDFEHIDIQHEKTGTVSMEISVEDMIGDAPKETVSDSVAISQKEPLSAYGTPKTIRPEGSLLSAPGCEGGHDCFACHMECGIRQKHCYCVEAPMGNPFPCVTLELIESLKGDIGERCQFVDNSLANHRTVDKEPVPCCKNCTDPCRYACERARKVGEAAEPVKTFNTELTGCIHREGYGCTLTNENKVIPGDGNACNCCWDCKYHGMCHFECNASAGRSGEVPVFDAAWFVKKWREICPGDFRKVANASEVDGAMSAKAKAIQEAISPYGAYRIGCSEWEFDFHGFAGGMDFKVGKESIHLKYGRLAIEILELLQEESSIEGLRDTVIVEEEKSHESQSEEPVVIDAEYTEVPEPPKEEYTLDFFLKEQNQKLEEFLKVEGVPCIVLERQKYIVAALASMKADLEIEEFKRTYKPEQPELPILKNNDQRGAFVDAYETWPLWIETKETGERYYRYDLPDGTSMVVKVYHAKIFDHSSTAKKWEDKYREGYGRQEYYLVREGKFFKDCETNRSYLIDTLKEIQRKDK